MGRLTAASRRRLPASDFALPGRRYPDEDRGHAKAARACVDEFGTPEEKRRVFAKTAKFFGKKRKGGSRLKGRLMAMNRTGAFKD